MSAGKAQEIGRPDAGLTDEGGLARVVAEAGQAPHPTAMIERPGLILRWLFVSFFSAIVFPPGLAERLKQEALRAQLVYVCPSLSYIEYLYFTYAFLLHGLPLSGFANGLRTVLFRPLGQLIAGLRAWVRDEEPEPLAEFRASVERGEASLLFLRWPRTLLGTEPSGFRGPYVEELIRIAREREAAAGTSGVPARPIVFVPLVLLWGAPPLRKKRTRQGLLDLVFGEREAPGRLRALLTFLRHFRSSQVRAGEPLDLGDFLRREAAREGAPTDEVLTRRLRWLLGGRLESEIRVARGPVRKGTRRIVQEVVRSRRVVDEAQEIARAEGVPVREVLKRAAALLDEIAAVPRLWAFEVLRPILAWIWRRIFDGIEVDVEGLERVREAARKGPLVLLPSHKSHIDYLVLSFVFVENDLVPPHIAAGANLSFFPLGFLFRRAGAFFLRRSFKGDRLYAAVFRAYVRKLLREGHSVEFFIEGGRSRTGKLLAPRMGLLGMVVDAALDDDGRRARKAQVVPISIGYEKVIEERSYVRELAGGEKRREDVRGLLKATRVLRGNYGRLNIQFDEPFELGDALREAGALVAWDEDESAVVPAAPASLRVAVQRLGYRVVNGINRVTAVTPTALVAAVLLGSGRRPVSRRALLEGAQLLFERARAQGGRIAAALLDGTPASSGVPGPGNLDVDALDRAIDLLASGGQVEIRGGAGTLPGAARSATELYVVPDAARLPVSYYRNNALHLWVSEALVCLALTTLVRGGGSVERVAAVAAVRARALELSRLFKREFSYRAEDGFDAAFDRTVGGLEVAGLLARERAGDEERLRVRRREAVGLLAGLLVDFVEAYWLTAQALAALEGPTPRRDALRRVREQGTRLALMGELSRPEACQDGTYSNAVEHLVEAGHLLRTGEEDLAPGRGLLAHADRLKALAG